jgi:DNA/RNA endonuclease YhcR with UshA esterase domain
MTTPRLCFVIASLLLLSLAHAEDKKDSDKKEPTTAPSKSIAANDKDALDVAMKDKKSAVVEGTVASAAWSSSGKVLIIKFKDTEESGFTAVIFAKDKDKMDAAFNGDVAKALSGAKVKLQGTIEPFREKPEIKIAKPTQISITEPSATTTKPAE